MTCDDLIDGANSDMMVDGEATSSSQVYIFDTLALVVCRAGYIVNGSSNVTVKCSVDPVSFNGEWTYPDVTNVTADTFITRVDCEGGQFFK